MLWSQRYMGSPADSSGVCGHGFPPSLCFVYSAGINWDSIRFLLHYGTGDICVCTSLPTSCVLAMCVDGIWHQVTGLWCFQEFLLSYLALPGQIPFFPLSQKLFLVKGDLNCRKVTVWATQKCRSRNDERSRRGRQSWSQEGRTTKRGEMTFFMSHTVHLSSLQLTVGCT